MTRLYILKYLIAGERPYDTMCSTLSYKGIKFQTMQFAWIEVVWLVQAHEHQTFMKIQISECSLKIQFQSVSLK